MSRIPDSPSPPSSGAPPPLSEPVFYILYALADRPRHGYGILLEIEGRTEGSVLLGTSTLYSALKRLLGEGWIEETDERPEPENDDERRRYYRLTDRGREVLTAEARRLEQLTDLARDKRLLPRLAPAGSAGARS